MFALWFHLSLLALVVYDTIPQLNIIIRVTITLVTSMLFDYNWIHAVCPIHVPMHTNRSGLKIICVQNLEPSGQKLWVCSLPTLLLDIPISRLIISILVNNLYILSILLSIKLCLVSVEIISIYIFYV